MAAHRRYLAFDLESSKGFPADSDWRLYRPLGIACAATYASDEKYPLLWQGLSHDGLPAFSMGRSEARALVRYLTTRVKDGYTVVTWNGLGFDFDVLAEESGLPGQCRNLAVSHVDMMFHVLCKLGHGVSLASAASGMRLSGKPKRVTGALVPDKWAAGKYDEVQDYVAQDAKTILDLATTCEKHGFLRWKTHRGRMRLMSLDAGWLVVKLADEIPERQSNMRSHRWIRNRFSGWLLRDD